MFQKLKTDRSVEKQLLEERRRLVEGARLAMIQWQYGFDVDHRERAALADLLERRYMYLYETAKQRKIHALE